MKKVALLLSVLFAFTFVNAQTYKEELDLMQSVFGMEKKSMVAEFVQVNDAQENAFWALYDQYEAARKELGKKRIELLGQYVNNWDNMTNATADALTKEVISLNKKTDALMVSYYNKVKKVTNPLVALQFYQVEAYILSGIRLEILGRLPLPDVK